MRGSPCIFKPGGSLAGRVANQNMGKSFVEDAVRESERCGWDTRGFGVGKGDRWVGGWVAL